MTEDLAIPLYPQGARDTPKGTAHYQSTVADADPTILSSDIQFDTSPVHTMPDALMNLLEASELLKAEEFLIRNTSTEGTFFIEIMAGECIITLGVLMQKVPCLKPWDLVCEILMELARRGRIDVFLGLPCQSFTFARDPALRNSEFPLGKPGFSPRQQDLVEKGNNLAAWALFFIKDHTCSAQVLHS